MGLTRNRDLPPLQQLLLVIVMVLLSAGLWYGWFAWDTEYYLDASTGEMAGPYRVWQGVGAFLCGIVVMIVAYRTLHIGVALVVLPASFTLAWISTAAADDVTGLWMVGAIMVAVGSFLGAAVLLSLTAAVDSLSREPSIPPSSAE
ncbi:hypothetical protein AC792_10195 [Arthrobacter sp. RIT-PI-e]|uniref:hypothetical protein n=1 Tax=Arthrobacter sp. RIT-PI-e TaxID=1681197 RepID=UPI00067670F5|nr:hypothetical protein [Arthrobacter sp. RIT-PI-e]KNC18783.1 hypothetical protein AC792_10195 [Arthrobacter sp. RIT-PI-e]